MQAGFCRTLGFTFSVFGFAPATPLLSQVDTAPIRYPLVTPRGLEPINVSLSETTYLGRKSVQVRELAGAEPTDRANGESLAILTDSDFSEGTIEVLVSGAPLPGAAEGARGFVGIAFHVAEGGSSFRSFYLRPTNGRTDDQLRRNHATQYVDMPVFPWYRLRKEEPGIYESYADMQPGAWTRMRVEVADGKARLYLNGAEQPSLIINDMKPGATRGKVALWIGQGTDAYFSDLTIRPRRRDN
jgi:hypothetical protein